MAALASFARTLQDRVAARPVPKSLVVIKIPAVDVHDDASAEIGYAEGQSFIIEYRDSAGNESTRRITVWGITLGVGGVPMWVATCHERHARRVFRADRIASCISYDGEVHDDVPQFLSDAFGMQIPRASRQADDEEMARSQRLIISTASPGGREATPSMSSLHNHHCYPHHNRRNDGAGSKLTIRLRANSRSRS